MSIKLRQFYESLIQQDTPFITRFGTAEHKQAWSDSTYAIRAARTRQEMVNAANRMGEIRSTIHRGNEDSTEYRLFYLQHGPEKYEVIKEKFGQDLADIVQKLRDDAKTD